MPFNLKKYSQIEKSEEWYNTDTAENTTDPSILHNILERNKDDFVSELAAENPNCSPETLKMVLERNEGNDVSQHAVLNPNCPPETLHMVLKRNNDDYVSRNAASNSNCTPETLRMVLERNKDDSVSEMAALNPNCPLESKIQWMRNTGKIIQEDPNKHDIDKSEDNKDEDLDKLKSLIV